MSTDTAQPDQVYSDFPAKAAAALGVVKSLVLRVDNFEVKLSALQFENLKMHQACRDTNRGIQRLRKNCDSQRKKLAMLKSAAPELWAQLFPPQRPSAVE